MSLRSTSVFYRQLATLLRAGFTMAQALAHAATTSSGWHGEHAQAWSDGCGTGGAFHEQLARAGENPFAVALVRAGEHSGRLPELCDRIAAIADHLMRLRSMLIGRLIYPFFLANAALAVPGLPKVFLDGVWYAPLIGPAILWTVIIAVVVTVAVGAQSGLAARLALQPGARFLALPWICANTCQVLEAGIAAGMLFHDALELAAPACGNRVMATRLNAIAADLRHGRIDRLATALHRVGFPPTVIQLVDGAEVSGTLEDGLLRSAAFQREAFESRSLWATRVFTGICYAIAIIGAAATVLSMYGAYVGKINEIASEME